MTNFREIDATEHTDLDPAPRGHQWYVATCKSGLELSALASLARNGHVAWYPNIERWIIDKSAKRRVHAYRPLFEGYLFISPSPNASRSATDSGKWVKWLPGGRSSSRIGTAMVERFSDDQANGKFIDWRNAPNRAGRDHKIGSSIIINTGPFEGIEGIVTKTAGERIAILITLMGQKVPVHIDSTEAIKSP